MSIQWPNKAPMLNEMAGLNANQMNMNSFGAMSNISNSNEGNNMNNSFYANRAMKPNYSNFATLTGHTKAISAVKFSPDGNWLASSCKHSILFINNNLF